MHPRNPFYNNPPDFNRLARLYPNFQKYCTFNKNSNQYTLDFKNPECLKALCCTLLKDVYNLNVDIPVDHIIPRVPQRLNYALWVEDLMKISNDSSIIYGIDIGCGPSCIFGLLMCSLIKQCKMLVTDIDEENVKWAQENVTANNLNERIKIEKVESGQYLIDLFDKMDNHQTNILFKNIHFDFLMCNPPFYSNDEEKTQRVETSKRNAPHSVNTAQRHEAIVEGGEVSFVKQLINESLILKERIKIYSSMFGKKSSLIEIKKYLCEKNVKNISHTEFSQGKTTRWGIAWSFSDDCLPQLNILNKEIEIKKTIKEKTMSMDFSNVMNQHELKEFVHKILLNDLKFKRVENTEDSFFAFENTWSYQRAKRRKLARNEESSSKSNDDEQLKRKLKEPIFQFKMSINQTNNGTYRIGLNPIEKHEPKIYESFNQILQYLKNRLSSIKNVEQTT